MTDAAIIIQRNVPARGIPSASSLRLFARAALPVACGELTIRIVDEAESQALNRDYRGKDKPTNVLSFDGDAEFGVAGDLVICAPVVAREAVAQGKRARAHWAHMVVHGCLHVQGHDHVESADAQRMEALEIKILQQLGFDDPYQ
ncbi:rRNA maturation RNase YbeY [Sinimarinibacterium sp. NLF-5-8]|uniref:rRNA maturation RNase YbeY n=1 Tax=Sinimarinibacterium sp. NLF-5-8 TaxID=2698684 RepID=UPI00137BA674|nr:rRNA maturation RNase YbeY [Sinimarinibacterium sp. NLF-5-8]QHS10022.1 rRNA maturation RNase YbeY [Sinimarinibacterium sp. NLF-5-8]